MKCPKCQHENTDKAKFCEECAAPLPRTCANCGSRVSLTAKFCPECGHPLRPVADNSRFASPKSYTPQHLADKILTSRAALEGERKQVTVLFADIKGSMELLADRDPEDAQKLLDPVLERMIEAVHRYEGTVNRVMGDGREPIGATRTKPGSVNAAIASYYTSPEFKRRLAPSSQEVRRAVLERFRRDHGDNLIRAMPTKFLRALLESMEPTAAKNWLAAIRALAQHCIKLELIDNDPTLGIKLRRIGGDGHHTWTEEELAQFESVHPIGSRERLAFALGLYTGQRRGDVIRMGRQHVRGDVLRVTQRKTGATLALPIHPELAAVLATVPADRLTFLQTLRGTPFTDHAFSDWFGKACDAAGLSSECTFHGLRKAACRRLAEAGCTVHEIKAISGHASLHEVERYTRAADQMKLARAAMKRATTAQKGVA